VVLWPIYGARKPCSGEPAVQEASELLGFSTSRLWEGVRHLRKQARRPRDEGRARVAAEERARAAT